MAATMMEVDSFIGKFKQLWKSGFNVDLCIKSKAGNAFLTLSLAMDSEPGPSFRPPCRQVFSSTSSERRKFSRENEKVTPKVNKGLVQASVPCASTADPIDNLPEISNIKDESIELTESENTCNVVTAEVKSQDESVSLVKDLQGDSKVPNVIDNDEGSHTLEDSKVDLSSIQKVYTTVEFTSSKSSITDQDVDSLLYTLRSKEHLQKNIKAVEEGKWYTVN